MERIILVFYFILLVFNHEHLNSSICTLAY